MIAALKWGALALVVCLVLAIAAAFAIGACLPRHHIATRARKLAAPRAAVWALISDPRGHWRRGLAAVTVEADGRRWREGAGDDAVCYEVVESDGMARLVVRIADDQHRLPYGGRWIYRLADDGDGTRITITEDGEVRPAMWRFVARFIIGHARTIERYLDDLAAIAVPAAHGGRAGRA